jgi:hypothetical protein
MMIPTELNDRLSPEFQEDAATLIEYLAEFAALSLDSRKAFLPAAAAITTDGELEAVATLPAGFADSAEMFGFLVTAATQRRDSWRSAAFVRAVVDPDYGDAVEFQIDSASDDTAIAALLTYQPGGLWRATDFGDLLIQLHPKFVWVGESEPSVAD